MHMRKLLLSAVLVGVAACAGDSPTAPVAGGAAANQSYYRGPSLPGARRTQSALSGDFVPLNCVPRTSAQGSAVIGPAGGTLWIGAHRLIVPAGALTEKVLISGTVPEGRPFEIDLQPHGLQFRKAAGLILDARSCVDVPPIVYLIDQVNVSPPIAAIYSNWWKMIACPIWHFSGYAVAFYSGEEANAGSAQ
jgi:hypothetical protein